MKNVRSLDSKFGSKLFVAVGCESERKGVIEFFFNGSHKTDFYTAWIEPNLSYVRHM